MKKNNFLKLLVVFVGLVSFTSCVEDKETYASIADKPIVSLAANTYTVNEGEDVLVTMEANRAYKASMDFNLEIVSGTATDGDDFTVNLDETILGNDPWNGIDGYLVSFPANQSSYTFSLSTILDDLAEGTESVTFKLTMSGNRNGVLLESSRVFTVNIVNQVQDNLSLTFDWDQSFDFAGNTYTLCDIVYDNDFYLVSGSTIVAAAASADCPEVMDININDYPDGDYDIYQNLYDDNGLASAGISPAFDIPVTVHYNRAGSATLSGTYVQDAAYVVNSDTPADPSFNNPIYVVSVHIEAGVFTLFDDNGNIASGKLQQVKNAVKAYKLQHPRKK